MVSNVPQAVKGASLLHLCLPAPLRSKLCPVHLLHNPGNTQSQVTFAFQGSVVKDALIQVAVSVSWIKQITQEIIKYQESLSDSE